MLAMCSAASASAAVLPDVQQSGAASAD